LKLQNKLSPSSIQSILECHKKSLCWITEKYKIVRINSSFGESYKIDGIVLHGVLENLFDTNNESSTENIRKEVIKSYSDNGVSESLIELSQDRLYKTINGVQNILSKVNEHFSVYDFETILKEYEYIENEEFTGIADLLFRGPKKSIVVDYKSGHVLDSEGQIKENFVTQMMLYGFLEIDEYGCEEVQLFILDSKGIVHKVDSTLEKISSNLEFIRNKYKDFVDEKHPECLIDNCVHCSIPHDCNNYFPPSNTETLTSISGEFIELVEKGSKNKMNLKGLKKPYKNVNISIYFDEPIFFSFEKSNLLTINNLKFVRKNNEKLFFKADRFWNINLLEEK